MSALARAGDIFEHAAAYDPAAGDEAFLKNLPARWAVFLLAGESDRPLQLLCYRDMRAAVRRRLTEPRAAGPSRRIDYRALVRRVCWTPCDSAFEAEMLYFEAARQVFGDDYESHLKLRPVWFAHVNPDDRFPRYVCTKEAAHAGGCVIGPFDDRRRAAALVELLTDVFDLCRHHHILVQAPHGRACAYKDMGRCAAPCDGSIDMSAYRDAVRRSIRAASDPQAAIAERAAAMRRAAAALRFEEAARIRAGMEKLAQLVRPPLRYARPLEEFSFVSLQAGPHLESARVFVIGPGVVRDVASIPGPPGGADDLAEHCREVARGLVPDLSRAGLHRIALTARYLMDGRPSAGAFVPLAQADGPRLARAYEDLRRAPKQQHAGGHAADALPEAP